MKKTIFKAYAVFAAVLFVLQIYASAENTSFSWYFKPSGNHEQPEVTPEAKSFIDKYDTIYLGDEKSNKIYLTFDAGYENGNVEKILDVLKEKNVQGAFFILPHLVECNTDLVIRMKNEGHLVCNHTLSHKNMSKVTDFENFSSELTDLEKIFYDNTGFEMDKFYRPPEGRFSETNLEFADRLGYHTVFWSLAYADWDNNSQMAPEKALELISARTHSGCVVLLHPTSSTNAEILGKYIDNMREQGYEFSTLEDFITEDDTDAN